MRSWGNILRNGLSKNLRKISQEDRERRRGDEEKEGGGGGRGGEREAAEQDKTKDHSQRFGNNWASPGWVPVLEAPDRVRARILGGSLPVNSRHPGPCRVWERGSGPHFWARILLIR